MRRDKNGQFLSNKGMNCTVGCKATKEGDLVTEGVDEMYTYHIDGGKVDDFRAIWDNGYELFQVNQENMIEAKERRLREAWAQFHVLEEQKEKASQWLENVSFVIGTLDDKVTKYTNELLAARRDYKANKEWFLRNGWIFTTKKALPDWALMRIAENNLDLIQADGEYIKMLLEPAKQNRDNLIEEVEFCEEFHISDTGYFEAKMTQLHKMIEYIQNDVMLDIKKLDGLLNVEDEDAYLHHYSDNKVYDLLEDKDDEYLCMLISTSENGIGVSKAEEILNKRFSEFVERMRIAAEKAKAAITCMEEMEAAASLNYTFRGAEMALETMEINHENRVETKRLKRLVEAPEKLTVVALDKCWYDVHGRETKDPNAVVWGYSEIQYTPIAHKFDALRHRAFDSLSGKVALSFRRMEEAVDGRLGLMSNDDIQEALSA
jgi:hypothetical protein